VDVYDVDWCSLHAGYESQNKKIMLVLGTERDGIPMDIIQAGVQMLAGCVVSIPQRGVIRSHNLSMAFAIVAGCMIKDLGWY